MSEKTNKEIAFEFLIEEYKELNNTLHINEEKGEKRLEFFLTLSSVVLGAIGLFIKEFATIDKKFLDLIYLLIILLLIGLICIGFIIQRRLKKRNRTTDKLKSNISQIREIFKRIDFAHTILPANYTAFSHANQQITPQSFKRRYTSLLNIAAVFNFVLGGAAGAFISFAFGMNHKGVLISSAILATITIGISFFTNRKL